MKKIIIISILLVSLFLIACDSIPSEKACEVDVDCQPSACCHADDAINKEFAPDCAGQICTMECKPGTIDCGQGKVACIDSQCTVILNEG